MTPKVVPTLAVLLIESFSDLFDKISDCSADEWQACTPCPIVDASAASGVAQEQQKRPTSTGTCWQKCPAATVGSPIRRADATAASSQQLERLLAKRPATAQSQQDPFGYFTSVDTSEQSTDYLVSYRSTITRPRFDFDGPGLAGVAWRAGPRQKGSVEEQQLVSQRDVDPLDFHTATVEQTGRRRPEQTGGRQTRIEKAAREDTASGKRHCSNHSVKGD